MLRTAFTLYHIGHVLKKLKLKPGIPTTNTQPGHLYAFDIFCINEHSYKQHTYTS